MAVIAISGGIGAGKSALVHALRARGYSAIMTDELAQDCLNQPEIFFQVTSKYPELLGLSQTELRHNLAEIVFSNSAELSFLENLIHPCVQQKIKENKEKFDGKLLFVEVPVLKAVRNYDFVVIVNTPEDVRIKRLINRGLGLTDIQNRIANQPDESEFLKIADYVLDGALSEEEFQKSLTDLIAKIESSSNV